MKLIYRTIENAADIRTFIYSNSWGCEHLKKLSDDHLNRICELVASICEHYAYMAIPELNGILLFNEKVKALYNEIIENQNEN